MYPDREPIAIDTESHISPSVVKTHSHFADVDKHLHLIVNDSKGSADSTGRCNSLVKPLGWRFVIQCLPRTFIEPSRHSIEPSL
ncbi:hypothetical protein QFZ94_002158 [Paraburkholderia sp. JPY465]